LEVVVERLPWQPFWGIDDTKKKAEKSVVPVISQEILKRENNKSKCKIGNDISGTEPVHHD